MILKSPYMKPGRSAGLWRYVQYIATREGVETPEKRERLAVTGRLDRVAASFLTQYPDCKDLFEYEDYLASPTAENARQLILAVADAHPEIFQSRSGYVKYMANRPGVERKAAHGLFSSAEEQPDLKAVQEELDSYEGNVWTHIISLRREDAVRLGYDRADAWQEWFAQALSGFKSAESVAKKKAAGYFEKAAAVKNKDAVYALGKLLVDPTYSGFNPVKGAELLRHAAFEDDNDNAAVLLGRLLLKGEWVQRNTEEALNLLFRAANRQNVFAMTILGRAFLYGDGIPEDKIFGREMLTAAANLGGEYAQTLLNRLNQPREISPEQIASAAVFLLAQAARMIENEIHDPVDPQAYALDSKLRRKDREKKLAQGQKLG